MVHALPDSRFPETDAQSPRMLSRPHPVCRVDTATWRAPIHRFAGGSGSADSVTLPTVPPITWGGVALDAFVSNDTLSPAVSIARRCCVPLSKDDIPIQWVGYVIRIMIETFDGACRAEQCRLMVQRLGAFLWVHVI